MQDTQVRSLDKVAATLTREPGKHTVVFWQKASFGDVVKDPSVQFAQTRSDDVVADTWTFAPAGHRESGLHAVELATS